MNPNLEEIKWLILNHNEPLLLKGFLHWDILEWDLNQWAKVLGDEEMQFRLGKIQKTEDPQWECSTKIIKGTFNDFLNVKKNNENEWMYFDYKYLRESFLNKKDIHNSISWDNFGFSGLKSEDSTIWIGSKGSHTPCHIDTYGCNLIAQIYGKKRWIMFPPEENLLPTRIPYEESSVYSKLNLFSPESAKFKDIKQCKSIILNPGEVLLLPHGWWHYVENLESAISINVWLPLPTDNEKRLEESLIQMFISQMAKDLEICDRKTLLNPNPVNEYLHKQDIKESVNLVDCCMQSCKIDTGDCKTKLNSSDILNKYKSTVCSISDLTKNEFHNLIFSQENRFTDKNTSICKQTEETDSYKKIVDIINAFTNPDVIKLVKYKLLNR